jgi:LPS O-antigen subunit length determinant protein (WzzB/FepE family)
MNTAPSTTPAQSDDLLALIKAVRLMWKHKKLIALVTLLFTVGGG